MDSQMWQLNTDKLSPNPSLCKMTSRLGFVPSTRGRQRPHLMSFSAFNIQTSFSPTVNNSVCVCVRRWEDHSSVHQVHRLQCLSPGPVVPIDIRLQLPMLQQQPVQLRRRRYRGNACPGFSELAARCLVVLELNGAMLLIESV